MMPLVDHASELLEGPSLREILSTVISGLPIALVAGIVLAVAANLGSGLLPSRYEATATVLASQPGADLTRLGLPYQSASLDLDAYVAIAKGDAVWQRAADAAEASGGLEGVVVNVEPSRSPSARLLNVTATAGSSEVAAEAANGVASALVAWDRDRVGRDIKAVASVMEQQVAALRARLGEAVASDGAEAPATVAVRTELAQRENELSALRAVASAPPATLQLLEVAAVPDDASSPNVVVNTALGFLVGFFLALALYLMRAAFDTRVRGVPGIERATGLPVVAELPRIAKDQGAYFQAMSYVAAATRSGTPDGRAGVVLVTSVRERDPRATAAIHLAACFAADGERTLLVDANTQAPIIGQRLGLDRSAAPTTRMYVSSPDDATLEPTGVRVGKHAELKVVPSYPPPGGMDLGAKVSLARWVDRWQDEYDTVVLDTAPVLEAADALTLARIAKAVLIVVTPGVADAGELRHAVEALERSGALIVGIVTVQPEGAPLARLGLRREPNQAPVSLASLGRI